MAAKTTSPSCKKTLRMARLIDMKLFFDLEHTQDDNLTVATFYSEIARGKA
jgi:hypothetical protein